MPAPTPGVPCSNLLPPGSLVLVGSRLALPSREIHSNVNSYVFSPFGPFPFSSLLFQQLTRALGFLASGEVCGRTESSALLPDFPSLRLFPKPDSIGKLCWVLWGMGGERETWGMAGEGVGPSSRAT